MIALDEHQMRWVAGGTDNDSDILVEGERPDDDDDDWPEDPPRDPWADDDDIPPPPSPTPPPTPPAQPADNFKLEDVDCPKEKQNLNTALNELLLASPTAASLISEMQNEGWTLRLVNNGKDETFLATMTIAWDPYSAIEIKDAQGNVTGVQSAMIGLAHEFAHAHLWDKVGGSGEAAAIELERKIIGEYNAYYGREVESYRYDHGGTPFNAASSVSHAKTNNNTRPTCG